MIWNFYLATTRSNDQETHTDSPRKKTDTDQHRNIRTRKTHNYWQTTKQFFPYCFQDGGYWIEISKKRNQQFKSQAVAKIWLLCIECWSSPLKFLWLTATAFFNSSVSRDPLCSGVKEAAAAQVLSTFPQNAGERCKENLSKRLNNNIQPYIPGQEPLGFSSKNIWNQLRSECLHCLQADWLVGCGDAVWP